MKQGIFYPELTLGVDALSVERKAELRQFLYELVCQRDCPLHIANLWNALYFCYDLDARGFHPETICPNRIPTRTAESRDRALPIGGFVRVHTQIACGDLIMEVVYKEGAHPELDESWIEAGLSGARARVEGQLPGGRVALVRERYVLDRHAFHTAITTKQYVRLCRKARWLDRHGHLVMEAMYPPADAALEDLDYYAHYLLTDHRDGLLAFCFRTQPTDGELREALLRSFESVRALAASHPGLRSWRDKYYYSASSYNGRLAGEGILGAGDLQTIYRGLMHVARGEQRSYSAIGPRILELLERGGLDAEEEAQIHGTAYATAVCHANTYVAETLAQQQPSGVSIDGVHLRLDDDWQAGGVWRAERVEDAHRYSLATVPATVPMGLGFAETMRLAGDEEIAYPEDEPLAATQDSFRVALTLRDRALGRLRMTSRAAGLLAQGPTDVVISHDGDRERMQVERGGSSLYGLDWPWSCHPGIILICNVEPGGSVVRVRSERVTSPVVAPDGSRFDFVTNLTIYQRETQAKELTPHDKREAPTLRELINRAFRLRGQPHGDGARALTFVELATVVLGPAWSPAASRPIANALGLMALEHEGDYYLWRPRVTASTRASDRSLLAAYGEEPSRRLRQLVRTHWVPMHLRRRASSMEKRRTYPAARTHYGMHGVLPAELPEGYTWVEPHERRGNNDTAPGQDERLERREYLAAVGA